MSSFVSVRSVYVIPTAVKVGVATCGEVEYSGVWWKRVKVDWKWYFRSVGRDGEVECNVTGKVTITLSRVDSLWEFCLHKVEVAIGTQA